MTSRSPLSERDEPFAPLLSALRELLVGVEFTTETADGLLCLKLPSATGADFRWSIWLYANGERHVYATDAHRAVQDAVEDIVVWYHPFEPDGFKGDQRALDDALLTEMGHLLTHHTRIRREAKFLNEAVELESSLDGRDWVGVYGYSELRTPRALLPGDRTARGILSSPPLLEIGRRSRHTL